MDFFFLSRCFVDLFVFCWKGGGGELSIPNSTGLGLFRCFRVGDLRPQGEGMWQAPATTGWGLVAVCFGYGRCIFEKV